MSGIVHAIPGIEVQDSAPAGSIELGSDAAVVADIHLQNLEQRGPSRIDVLRVGALLFPSYGVDRIFHSNTPCFTQLFWIKTLRGSECDSHVS
jgi:hypothetical protein